MPALPTSEIERVFREEYGRAVAVLVRVFGDIDVAEEAVQDAFTAAVRRWPSSGLPPSPAGWIITTARNRAIDRLRREASREDRHAQAALLHAHGEVAKEGAVRDERLRLIFTPREVLARVRAVLRRAGGEPAPARVLQVGGLRLDLDRHVITRDAQAIDMTPTEFDLLKVFMEYPGHAFTRAELIEKSLGYTYDGLDRGVDSHIKNLRKKIEPDAANPTYIQTVYGAGYRLQR